MLEASLVLSCQNACTSPFTAYTNFMSLHGNLPLNAHNFSIWPSMSRLSLLIEYFFRVFRFKLIIFYVHLIKRCCIVLILTIDSANTRCAILQPFERDFLPIDVNALTRDLTMWLLDSLFLNILCPIFFYLLQNSQILANLEINDIYQH